MSREIPSFTDPLTVTALAHFRDGTPLTRAQLGERTGWARVTVTARLEQLLDDGLVAPVEERAARRGRPALAYGLVRDRAALVVADIGVTGMRVARCDLAGGLEQVVTRDSTISEGPDVVLAIVRKAVEEVLRDVDRSVWGVAVSLPGPIEHPSGRVVDPPVMTGWDGFDVRGALGRWFDSATHVENDVNAMALGEVAAAAERGEDLDDVLVVKVGTGVGAGIVSGGQILRGAAGAAGDLGHTEADPRMVAGGLEEPQPCRCGKSGCVEAYAGGWALVRDARAAGLEVRGLEDFLGLLAAGDPVARRLTSAAGSVLGSAIATTVSLVNPRRVLLGGAVGLRSDLLLDGVRERVYARSLPLATRSLVIDRSALRYDAGLRGLADQVSRRALAPASGSPVSPGSPVSS